MMTVQKQRLIIVMPVYEDRACARRLIAELARSCPELPYIIGVEDGSIRDPLRASDICESGLQGEVLYLARNMGHQRAIAVGLAYVSLHLSPELVVVMDSDGEDRPESIPALIERLKRNDVDAVVARRRKRSESLNFRIFYFAYKLIFEALTGKAIAFGNFSALSPLALRRVTAMQEAWVHYAASLMVSRLRIGEVPTDRGKRYAGTPHMNFVSLTLHGMRSIMVFAEDVLVRVGLFSTIVATASIVLLGVAAGLKLADLATPGWFSPAIGILFIIFMQAGVLTFVTLMVSGLVRSAPPLTRAEVDQLVYRIERTQSERHTGLASAMADLR
jgi:hypothetical protein